MSKRGRYFRFLRTRCQVGWHCVTRDLRQGVSFSRPADKRQHRCNKEVRVNRRERHGEFRSHRGPSSAPCLFLFLIPASPGSSPASLASRSLGAACVKPFPHEMSLINSFILSEGSKMNSGSWRGSWRDSAPLESPRLRRISSAREKTEGSRQERDVSRGTGGG